MDLHGVGGLAGTIRDQPRGLGSTNSIGQTQVLAQSAADVKNHLLAYLC